MNRFLLRARAMLPILVLFALAAAAQDVTTVFVQPKEPLRAGNPGSVWLYCMNNSPRKINYTFPASLDCTLTTAAGVSNAQLTLNASARTATVAIPAGRFAKKEYLLSTALPEGRITLDVSNFNQIILMAQTNSAPVGASPTRSGNASRQQPLVPHPMDEFLAKHLSTYEPIYFLLGSYPAAEFQFSLKYQLFSFTNEDNFAENAADHFFFAYTQTSFWDLISRDPSFYDSSYKPSLFFYYTNVLQSPSKTLLTLDLQPGAEHESNGKGGADERSLYTAYLQPTANFHLPDNFYFTLQPRARTYYLVGQNNPDIADYRGYVDLLAAFGWNDPHSEEKVEFSTKFTIGDGWKYPGTKFDLRFNLARIFWLKAFNPTIQIQYFTGYGQTLLQYNQPSHAIRAGLCLWYF
jgi:outer membrane phospholipase A